MDEALFARLAEWLADGRAVVLASVLSTHGATPRKRDARMLVDADNTAFSIGGGAAEGRVIEAARRLIDEAGEQAELVITLNGRNDAAGVCGGGMRLALRRWQGDAALQRARRIATRLAAGETDVLYGDELGTANSEKQRLQPNPRLLILGAGHCGYALAQLARFVEFDVYVADSRAEYLRAVHQAGITGIDADAASLCSAADTGRDLYLVLLNRDYATDVAALTALHGVCYAFLGMMGSRKRIAQVKKALPESGDWLQGLVAPVGLKIGEQTPHEIAISILAQLIQRRAAIQSGADQDEVAAAVPFSSR